MWETPEAIFMPEMLSWVPACGNFGVGPVSWGRRSSWATAYTSATKQEFSIPWTGPQDRFSGSFHWALPSKLRPHSPKYLDMRSLGRQEFGEGLRGIHRIFSTRRNRNRDVPLAGIWLSSAERRIFFRI